MRHLVKINQPPLLKPDMKCYASYFATRYIVYIKFGVFVVFNRNEAIARLLLISS